MLLGFDMDTLNIFERCFFWILTDNFWRRLTSGCQVLPGSWNLWTLSISQGVLVPNVQSPFCVTREAKNPCPWFSHFNRTLCQFICVCCCYVFKSGQTMRCSVAQRLLPGVRSFAVGVMLASFYCMHPVCGL